MLGVIIFCVISIPVACSHDNKDAVLDVHDIMAVLSDYKKQIDSIKMENEILVQRINALEEENKFFKSRLELGTKNTYAIDEKSSIQTLQDNLREKPNHVRPEKLKTVIVKHPGSTDSKNQRESDEIEDGEIGIGNKQGGNVFHGKRSTILRSVPNSGSQVGFHATIRQQTSISVGKYQGIVFENVLTNVGNGYDPSHGVFIAPVAGMYSFTSQIYTFTDLAEYFIILKNGNRVCNVHKQHGDHMAVCTVVLTLNGDDRVHVQNTDHPVSDLMGHDYSSFSGFLI